MRGQEPNSSLTTSCRSTATLHLRFIALLPWIENCIWVSGLKDRSFLLIIIIFLNRHSQYQEMGLLFLFFFPHTLTSRYDALFWHLQLSFGAFFPLSPSFFSVLWQAEDLSAQKWCSGEKPRVGNCAKERTSPYSSPTVRYPLDIHR